MKTYKGLWTAPDIPWMSNMYESRVLMQTTVWGLLTSDRRVNSQTLMVGLPHEQNSHM